MEGENGKGGDVENKDLHFVNRRMIGKQTYAAFKRFRPYSIWIRRSNETEEQTGSYFSEDRGFLARVWNNDGALSGLPFQ